MSDVDYVLRVDNEVSAHGLDRLWEQLRHVGDPGARWLILTPGMKVERIPPNPEAMTRRWYGFTSWPLG